MYMYEYCKIKLKYFFFLLKTITTIIIKSSVVGVQLFYSAILVKEF